MFVKLMALNELEFLSNFRNSAKSREGALLAFECFCEKLGKLFEPYVLHYCGKKLSLCSMSLFQLICLFPLLVQVCDSNITTTSGFFL